LVKTASTLLLGVVCFVHDLSLELDKRSLNKLLSSLHLSTMFLPSNNVLPVPLVQSSVPRTQNLPEPSSPPLYFLKLSTVSRPSLWFPTVSPWSSVWLLSLVLSSWLARMSCTLLAMVSYIPIKPSNPLSDAFNLASMFLVVVINGP